MKRRIWELDALRGVGVIGMIFVHGVYDLVWLYRIVDWDTPALFDFIKEWGGVLFLLISGICVTLGSRSVRRGLIVVACGLLVTAVTAGMYLLGLSGKDIIIYFGVLHCLGVCMLVWPLFKKLPAWAIALLGAAMAAVGLWLKLTDIVVDVAYLVPLGLIYRGFSSADYFPLLPNLGFFLLGAVLGRTVYAKKQSLLPKVDEKNPAVRFLGFCGRNSLQIYMLHQPVLAGVIGLIAYFL